VLLALAFVVGCGSGSADAPEGDAATDSVEVPADRRSEDLAQVPELLESRGREEVVVDSQDPLDAENDDGGENDVSIPHLWPTCPEFSAAGPRLVDKTAFLDALVETQHFRDGLIRNVLLNEDGTLKALIHVPSTGLWTAMYLASQSYRYAVTGEPQALENARAAAEGLHDLTKVTGVPGLYGRSYQRPDFVYTGNPAGASDWTASTAEGYAGWWFNFAVSKDTMDGIMFGYATALQLLTDPTVVELVSGDVEAFIDHLISNGLQIIDYDGVVTEHGRMYYSAMDDFPGFNAMLVSSWIRTALTALDRPDFEHFYYDCLMRKGDTSDCPAIDPFDLGSYMSAIETTLATYMQSCQTSYDHIDMVFHAIDPLFKRETDADLKQRLEAVLDNEVWQSSNPKADPPVHRSTHALYIFIYGALKEIQPGNAVFDAAIADAVCTMFRLPQDRSSRHVAAGQQETACLNRQGDPNAAEVIPIEQRHFDNYLWRLDPYEIPREHPVTPGLVYSPEDYLLAYWMGRYYGFLRDDM
jgi:hypothetical protein